MPELERVGSLEVHQDMDFQRREWRVQQFGWAAMLLFLVAAVAGLFGAGPISSATAGEEGSTIWVDYERFGRRGAPARLRVHAVPASQEFKLLIDRGYLEALKIESISPEPHSAEASGSWVVYTFRVAESGAGPTAVTFELQPDHIGRLQGRISAEGQTREFTQFIYP